MNAIAKWALRTAGLWALSMALQLANEKLKQRQRERKKRARPLASAAR